jgi:hypothetical protein
MSTQNSTLSGNRAATSEFPPNPPTLHRKGLLLTALSQEDRQNHGSHHADQGRQIEEMASHEILDLHLLTIPSVVFHASPSRDDCDDDKNKNQEHVSFLLSFLEGAAC